MSFSKKLETIKDSSINFVNELARHYKYVSILGSDVKSKAVITDFNALSINEGIDKDFGFVVKLTKGKFFMEYSLDEVMGNACNLVKNFITLFMLIN